MSGPAGEDRAHEDRAHEDIGRVLADVIAGHPVVDLTLPLAEQLPCTWPGHMPFRATVWTWFADRPGDPQPVRAQCGGHYQTRWLVLDEHVGTHIDAPRHFVPPPGSGLAHAGAAGEIGVGQLPLLGAAGPADVIDVEDLTETELSSAPGGVSPRVTPRHVERWEEEHGTIAADDVVLLRGG